MREILSPSLAERTSLHLGGRAIAELVLERAEDYPLLAERLQQLGGSPFIIGAGTNLLARDGELPVVLLRSAIKEGPEIVWESEARAHVRAGAGVPLPRLLGFCARRGLGGLEGLVGIPGSVGGGRGHERRLLRLRDLQESLGNQGRCRWSPAGLPGSGTAVWLQNPAGGRQKKRFSCARSLI